MHARLLSSSSSRIQKWWCCARPILVGLVALYPLVSCVEPLTRDDWSSTTTREQQYGSETDAAATSSTARLTPTDDAWVYMDAPEKNTGSDMMLVLRSAPARLRYSFLKFDASSFSASSVSSATLRIFGDLAYSTCHVAGVIDDSWSESAINWSNMPTFGSDVDATECAVGWNELDVTTFVNQELVGRDRVVSFVLRASAGKYTEFHSKDNTTNSPELVLVP